MRHVVEEFDVYTFEELSDKAKERAREWFRGCMDGNDWMAEEWRASLKAFVELFNGKLRDYCYPERGRSYVKVDWSIDDCILELSGVRLWKYLNANYGGQVTVYDGGTVGSSDNPLRYHKEKRDGHAWILACKDGECPFTGCGTDCPFFDPLAEFVKRPDNQTFEELLNDCLESFLSSAADAYEAMYEDEYADDAIIANAYEFTENGDRY